MQTLTNANHRVHDNTCQASSPMWMVLHGGSGHQRRRWCPEIATLARELVEKYDWVIWHEGSDAHLKHRSMMAN